MYFCTVNVNSRVTICTLDKCDKCMRVSIVVIITIIYHRTCNEDSMARTEFSSYRVADSYVFKVHRFRK